MALWVLAVVAFIVAGALITRTLFANYTTDLSAPGGTFWDFRDASYYSVRATLDGLIPYDVDRYFAAYPVGQEFPILPPTYLLLHSPFQLLDLTAASLVMLGLNVIGIVLLSVWSLSLGRYRLSPLLVLVVSTLVIVSTGGRNLLITGQASLFFVGGTYLALTARGLAAGSVGVFATLIKPGFGLPVTLLVAAAGRNRRAVIGAVAAVFASLVLMIPFVIRAGGFAPIIDILLDNAAYSASTKWIALETTTARTDIAATIAVVFDVAPPRIAEILLGSAVIGGSAIVLFARRSALSHRHYGDAAVVLVSLATVTGIYHSFYDLVILVLPAILLSRRDFANGSQPPWLRMAMLGAVLVASFNPFKVDTVARVLPDSFRLVEILGPGLTGVSLIVAIALAAVAVWRLPAQVTGHLVSTDSG